MTPSRFATVSPNALVTTKLLQDCKHKGENIVSKITRGFLAARAFELPTQDTEESP